MGSEVYWPELTEEAKKMIHADLDVADVADLGHGHRDVPGVVGVESVERPGRRSTALPRTAG